ncbi:hypothetical protein L202_05349 [Cryptococcus amylolentus CBS 6039]|uniref:Template-activating factor I n=3 Tax=Cryptococcus amylolentus TaxID=104669 RepID=A0A1E3HLZ4_9TREE|nr:hypothetical protein L202_05349 [Cryptococcus amylolentus CBS 6039]ODN76726.1 hypothetical protein L202_05349 [Cryptococcus amylolentus CBS 6039]ODO04670.1 hypothetical protein I350_05279 [Cryptococcus amylolentus CBS 6273]
MSAAQDFQITAPEISESLRKELETKEGAKNVRLNRFQVKETLAYLDELRPKVKDIDNFWLIALMSHEAVAAHLTAKVDQHALSFLQDIELKQDVNDFRPFELVFHFKENPYFTNKSISKKYSLGPDTKPVTGEDVSEELAEFDEDSLVVEPSTIDWKPNQDLTAQFPRKMQGEAAGNGEADDLEDGFEGDPGTFFWYFVEKMDMFNFGFILKDDILPDAFAYFDGRGAANAADMLDSEDEDDEEDDEDDDEIDLENEKPKKKRKVCRDGCC